MAEPSACAKMPYAASCTVPLPNSTTALMRSTLRSTLQIFAAEREMWERCGARCCAWGFPACSLGRCSESVVAKFAEGAVPQGAEQDAAQGKFASPQVWTQKKVARGQGKAAFAPHVGMPDTHDLRRRLMKAARGQDKIACNHKFWTSSAQNLCRGLRAAKANSHISRRLDVWCARSPQKVAVLWTWPGRSCRHQRENIEWSTVEVLCRNSIEVDRPPCHLLRKLCQNFVEFQQTSAM